ncbi:hypothetical protein [Isobaculum melis]|uniref:LPXTG-motif cell wall anchor domain-containing protein n=1 Tax=Isobaculum melis TaxID=142588 RepID=A0A1H9QHE2_9LACT|nr:hypothetical protein [Isobaculum melis]SER59850.1 LPXTG-motif cell wall anchor domain-containing protein [Isobaculum melis]
MGDKIKKMIYLLIAFIGIGGLFNSQEVLADYIGDIPEVSSRSRVNLVPDVELTKQLNQWGKSKVSFWPTYIDITQEKFDLLNQYEGPASIFINLDDTPTKTLEGLQYLQPKTGVYLIIRGTEIEDISLLEQVGNLTVLSLTKPNLSGNELAAISQLNQLEMLEIETESNLELNMLANMSHLNELKISGSNQRIGLTPPTISFTLPNIQTVSIIHTNLSDASVFSTHMNNVQQLVLASLPLTDIDSFVRLPQLNELFLFDTFVSSYPEELTPLMQWGSGGVPSGNNWYEGEDQNKLGAIETKEILKNETLEVTVPLTISDNSLFIGFMTYMGMDLLTNSELFQAEITSSNPEVVSVNPTSTAKQLSLLSHNRVGTAVITYKLPSNNQLSFEVTVKSNNPPPVVQGKAVYYERNVQKTEADYLEDAKIVSDREATITTDFEQVVKLDQEGDYIVTVYATDEDGVASQKLQLTVTVGPENVELEPILPDLDKPSTPNQPNQDTASNNLVGQKDDKEILAKTEAQINDNKGLAETTNQESRGKVLPKTSSQDSPSFFFLGSLLIIVSVVFMRGKRVSVK